MGTITTTIHLRGGRGCTRNETKRAGGAEVQRTLRAGTFARTFVHRRVVAPALADQPFVSAAWRRARPGHVELEQMLVASAPPLSSGGQPFAPSRQTA